MTTYEELLTASLFYVILFYRVYHYERKLYGRINQRDIDKTYRILYGNFVLFSVISVLFLIIFTVLYTIFRENLTFCFLLGAFFIYLLTVRKWIRNIRKQKEKRISNDL